MVTIQGIATSGSSLGQIRYIQDSTGGIALYPGNGSVAGFEDQVILGTEVEVTGMLSHYHGLIEINPILSYSVESQGNVLPDPIPVALDELDAGVQSMLVRVNCIDLAYGMDGFGQGENAIHSAAGLQGTIYLSSGHPLINTPAPAGSFDITAIASYYDGVQLLPRDVSDVTTNSCFHVTYGPSQRDIRSDAFSMTWGTSDTATALFRIGTTHDNMVWSEPGTTGVDHMYEVSTLLPATVYHVQCGGVSAAGDTILSVPMLVSTASAIAGSIDVYFNAGVDDAFSNGSAPAGTSYGELYDNLISIIESAVASIDVAMYNSNRDDIILKLEEAQDRGVRVRYIADGDQSNGALSPAPDFPVLFRQGDGIMHHKFIVVDPHDPTNAQVWTGSTNFSTGQLALDPNNSLHIRDQALARAYLLEFNEMWGGEGAIPNGQQSRTGSEKADDTPHQFVIGDIPVECYFSPSDRTNARIIAALNTADADVAFALLLITRNDIASVLTDAVDHGVQVRGIINDLQSSQDVYHQLAQGGVSVQVHDPSSIFHHKYALIDYRDDASDPTVITGSHNWTTSATTRNDENTLIIHDEGIANMYHQEFEARWSELVSAAEDLRAAGFSIYPSPFRSTLHIDNETGHAQLDLLTMTGRPVYSTSLTGDSQLPLPDIPAGAYLLRLTTPSGTILSTVVVRQ